MRRSVSTYSKKPPVALIVCLTGKFRGVTRTARRENVHWQILFAQACENWSGEFRGAAATGGGVEDGEKSFHRKRN